ncbi:MAG: hypothetical protein ACXVPU_06815 [Bacteroidia bacterium]
MIINTIKKSSWKFAAATLVACSLFSCSSEPTDKTKEGTDSIPATETKTPKEPNLFYSVPSPIQLGQLLQKAGATYDKKILNSLDNVSAYSTATSKALNLGVYGADLSYSAVFNQNQETMSYLNNSKKLAEELGITSSFSAEMMKRMEKNEGNKDSLLQIISELFLSSNEALKENDQSNVSVLVLAGGFIEGMYVGTQTAKTVKDNAAIYKRIAELRGSLNNLIMLVATINDANDSDVLADLKSIKAIYGDAPAAASKPMATADTTKKTMTIGGKSNYTLTQDQIDKITAQVATIRAKIIKP